MIGFSVIFVKIFDFVKIDEPCNRPVKNDSKIPHHIEVLKLIVSKTIEISKMSKFFKISVLI